MPPNCRTLPVSNNLGPHLVYRNAASSEAKHNPKFRMAVHSNSLWPAGTTLRVLFLQNEMSAELTQRVKNVSLLWTEDANIRIEYVDAPPGDIRISALRANKENNSSVGTDAQIYKMANEATMNLDINSLESSQSYFLNTVLHEWGHALGSVHEQNSPQAKIQWNKEVVYENYRNNGDWSREKVDKFVMGIDPDVTEASFFDPESVMLYPIQANETLNHFSVGDNTQLSIYDKGWMRRCYPYDKDYVPTDGYCGTASASWNNGNDGRVFYQDTHCLIREVRRVNGVWSTGPTTIADQIAKRGTPLAAISWNNGKEIRVYSASESNELTEHSFGSSGWTSHMITKSNGQPWILDNQSKLAAMCWSESAGTISIRVYFQEPGNTFIHSINGAFTESTRKSSWVDGLVHPSALLGTSLAALSWFEGTDMHAGLFFQDASLKLHLMTYDPRYKWAQSTIFPTKVAPKFTPIYAAAWYTNTLTMYCWWVDDYNGIQELKWPTISHDWSRFGLFLGGVWGTGVRTTLGGKKTLTLAALQFIRAGEDVKARELHRVVEAV